MEDATLAVRCGLGLGSTSLPRPALAARTASTAEVAARFPKAARGGTAVAAFAHLLGFYGGFGAYVAGLVPAWMFATCGFFVFIRYFDLTHEEMHARSDCPQLCDRLRYVFSVSGPLQLGYTQLARSHRLHHAYEGSGRDPDAWIAQAPLLVAALHCLTQPEQAVVRYVRANGIDRRLAVDLGVHLSAWVGLAYVCSWPQFLLYNAVVRVGNGASWFVFTHVLHRAAIYEGFARRRLPTWLRVAWLALIGRNNLNAITYHFLHHAYGFVPARSLPQLSAHLAGRGSRGFAKPTSAA
jgi:fatty acid desaturase